MKKFILLILFFALAFSTAYAQQADELIYVKADIGKLLEENRRLQAEYDMLASQAEALHEKLNSIRQDISGMTSQMDETTAVRRDKARDMERAYRELKDSARMLQEKNARQQFLQSKMREIDARQDIRELKMRDLEYQKQELEMELEAISHRHSKELEARQKEWIALGPALEQVISEKNNLESQLAEMQKLIPEAPALLSDIYKESSQLEIQVMEKSNAKVLRLKEQEILKSKQLLAEKKQEIGLLPLSKEEKFLQTEVAGLQAEYNNLEKRVEESMSYQQKKRYFLNEIMHLDQQNRDLSKEIDSLRKAKKR